MDNIVLFVIIAAAFFYFYDTETLKCDSNDASCAAWTNKDLLSKCDSFCSNKLISFSHSQKYEIKPDGSVDCNCVNSNVNNVIGTPSTNVKVVNRENLPIRAGEIPKIEKLTNTTDNNYDSAKSDQYKRFNKLIFG